ncbi:MATE family efflux transporter [Thorsellia kenyensis]|uniref:Multidrug-efflux transporter n=1 Tax=Thorsellia kenyensis TaxID=1549888 RepID=A0ABV6CBG1_9GAMM
MSEHNVSSIKESKILLKLAIPVIFAQLAQTGMGAVDSIMAGRVSTSDLAAIAAGNAIWWPIILLAQGILLALMPVIAQLNGAGRLHKVASNTVQGFWLALFLSLVVVILFSNSHHLIFYLETFKPEHLRNDKTAQIAIDFLDAIKWGVPGYLFYIVLRAQNEALSITVPSMVTAFIGLSINVPLNYVLIYGKLGLPALGAVGCGYATATAFWIMFILMAIYNKNSFRVKDINILENIRGPDFKIIMKLIKIGLPIALAIFFEVTLFTAVTLMIYPMGDAPTAAHLVALNFSSLCFVLPLSLNAAATIRVGFSLGEKRTDRAKMSAYVSLFWGVVLASCTGIITLLFNEQIVRIYTQETPVVMLATQLLVLSAIYQISDAVQVIGSGILRGYKDTKLIFYATFISYWLIGLPSGYILGLTDWFVPAMGPNGFWIGFIIGLTTSAILLMSRMVWLQKQTDEFVLAKSS